MHRSLVYDFEAKDEATAALALPTIAIHNALKGRGKVQRESV